MTEFGKRIKKRLIDLEWSQKLLIEKVREETGLFVDGSYMSRIARGKEMPPKITGAICKILEIEAPGPLDKAKNPVAGSARIAFHEVSDKTHEQCE